jgi:hypothetical protein
VNQNPRNTEITKEGASSLMGTQWCKFEYFNFPVQQSSALHEHLQHHYSHLQQAYFDMNYIDKLKNEHDIASTLIDQTYDVIEQNQGKKILTKHKKQFGDCVVA